LAEKLIVIRLEVVIIFPSFMKYAAADPGSENPVPAVVMVATAF
jgi:hypothetical protein